ncbi:MAG: aldose epimerase family protein [Anaeromyxobacter sp.]
MRRARLERRPFGAAPGGEAVWLFTLRSRAGHVASVASFGATVTSLQAPDRQGRLGEVVLGHDTLDGYLADRRTYLGATVGRYANRIARGELALDGRTWRLAQNDGEHHLHGGRLGFDRAGWEAEGAETAAGPAVALRRLSPGGEEGYPGALTVEVTYTLSDAGELVFEAAATTTAPTVCNLAHHGYFNLDQPVRRDVLGHLLWIDAERFTPVGPGLIPTGELRHVGGTPMDFRTPTAVGARLGVADEQLRLAGGYDHNWIVSGSGGARPVARLLGFESGRTLEVLTTEPGLQLYSGNFLDGTVVGRGGQAFQRHAGLCLETQHFPDSPHQPSFPSTVLRPGETYRTRTVYRLGVE